MDSGKAQVHPGKVLIRPGKILVLPGKVLVLPDGTLSRFRSLLTGFHVFLVQVEQ